MGAISLLKVGVAPIDCEANANAKIAPPAIFAIMSASYTWIKL
jgi:hypothetical protein